MRPEAISLPVPAAVAAGASIDSSLYREGSVQIGGTFVATIQVEFRQHSSMPWSPVGAPLTAPGFVDVPHCAFELRTNVTAYTSGTPLGYFAGFNSRTD